MENLLDVEGNDQHEMTTFDRIGRSCRKPDERRNEKPGKRRGSYMVRLAAFYSRSLFRIWVKEFHFFTLGWR